MEFGIAVRTCILLVEKFPDGYTLGELHAELKISTDLSVFDEEWLAATILGMEDDRPHHLARVACWKLSKEGKIYFDPQAKHYSSYNDERMKKVVNEWHTAKVLGTDKARTGD